MNYLTNLPITIQLFLDIIFCRVWSHLLNSDWSVELMCQPFIGWHCCEAEARFGSPGDSGLLRPSPQISFLGLQNPPPPSCFLKIHNSVLDRGGVHNPGFFLLTLSRCKLYKYVTFLKRFWVLQNFVFPVFTEQRNLAVRQDNSCTSFGYKGIVW